MKQRELLNAIIADEEFQQLHRLVTGESIFSIMKIDEQETVHTRLLAWLLNPLAGHGMGSVPLKSFLNLSAQAVRKKRKEFTTISQDVSFIDPVAVSSFDLEKLKVRAEHPFTVSGRKGRIDVFVYAPGPPLISYLVIEYKVYAKESGDQTNLYMEYVKETEQPTVCESHKLHPLLVYLCRDEDNAQPAEPFVKIGYREFKGWVDALKLISTKTDQGRLLVDEFARLFETFVAGAGESGGLVEKVKHRYAEHVRSISDSDGEDEELGDPALDNAWTEYADTLKLVGIERKDPPIPEITQWDMILRSILNQGVWEINGKGRCLMVHNLGFRAAVSKVAGHLIKAPRLQFFVDKGSLKSPTLRFFYSDKAPLAVMQRLPREKFAGLVDSLKNALKQKADELGKLGVELPNENTYVLAKINVPEICSRLEDVKRETITGRFREIVSILDSVILEWIESSAFKALLFG